MKKSTFDKNIVLGGILFLIFQRWIALLFASVSGISPTVVNLGSECVFVAIFLIVCKGKIQKSILAFICITYVVGMVNYTYYPSSDLNVLVAFISPLRRLGLPMFALTVFTFLFRNSGIFRASIPKFMRFQFRFVIAVQCIDFMLSQSASYYSAVLGLVGLQGNSFLSKTAENFVSHIPIMEWQPVRAFGIMANFHASGLLCVFLFLVTKSFGLRVSLLEKILFIVAVMAGGSLQNFGELILIAPIFLICGFRYSLIFLSGVMLMIPVLSSLFVGIYWPILGHFYMFDYIHSISVQLIQTVLSGNNLVEYVFGFGNLRVLSPETMWSIPGVVEDIGDVGFLRIFFESGLIVIVCWLFIVLSRMFATTFNNIDCASRYSLVLCWMGLFSLIHYPVLFVPANITLFMFALAHIQYNRDSRRSEIDGENINSLSRSSVVQQNSFVTIIFGKV